MTEIQGRRIQYDMYLAQPKPFHPDYEENRRSVYWIDRTPFTSGNTGTTQIVASKRVRELSNPKPLSAGYRSLRPSPVWHIKRSTLEREPTERLIMLSSHRRPLAMPDRSVYSSVPSGIVRETTLDRLTALSQPRERIDRYSPNEIHWGQHNPVPFAAQIAQPTSRLEDLAKPKQYHPEFKPERPVQSILTDTALTSIANQHLQKLARPRARTTLADDFDPYKVSLASRRAKPTPRTELLSAPLPRKQRQKKIT